MTTRRTTSDQSSSSDATAGATISGIYPLYPTQSTFCGENLPPSPTSNTTTTNAAAQKRHKRYAPKVRTGCLTCKKRRVKCDETKPKCLKCLSSDYQCDGYVVPKAWIFERATKQPILPASNDGSSPGSSSSDEEKVIALIPALRTHTFTPDEARSIQFYLQRSGRIIAKYDHSRYTFWMESLPKAAHRFDSVKHMLVAIALQDELLTSPTTIPKIERRITYHYQQSLQRTAYSKSTIDQILLNCLSMYYFESLRDNIELIVLHIESARKMIDEWQAKDEKAVPELLELIEDVNGIVTEAQNYAQTTSNPPEAQIDWDKLPSADPYDSAEDAEHSLIACMGNLSRAAGQTPMGLVRGRVYLQAWVSDSRDVVRVADVDFTVNLASLFEMAQNLIDLLDGNPRSPQDQRWYQLLASLQAMPKLRSVKYRKPVTALVDVLQQRAETAEQVDTIKALQKHLQRGIVYDG